MANRKKPKGTKFARLAAKPTLLATTPPKDKAMEDDWEMQALRLKDYLVALKAVLGTDREPDSDTWGAADTLCDLALANVREQFAAFDRETAAQQQQPHNKKKQSR